MFLIILFNILGLDNFMVLNLFKDIVKMFNFIWMLKCFV